MSRPLNFEGTKKTNFSKMAAEEEKVQEPFLHPNFRGGEFAKRAELFHQLIMEDFRFLQAARINSRQYEQSMIGSDAVQAPTQLRNLMKKTPQGLVSFSRYGVKKATKSTKQTEIIHNDYRSRRFTTRLSTYPPLDVWSRWVLTRNTFSALMILVILLNSIIIIIEGELADDSTLRPYRVIVDTLDFLFLAVFVIDILFKLMDSGWSFFLDGWNVFDFLVTIGSSIAVIIDIIFQDTETELVVTFQVVHYIRVFRIFRAMNVVTRWKRISLLWIAVINTVRSLVYILLLMFLFFYIFALIAIQLFDRFTQSHIKDLEYRNAFENLGRSILTLFQLFTLDHWYKLIVSIMRVMSYEYPIIFILIWILLGSFIFKNIFMGVMVSNFQLIRRQLTEESDSALHKEVFGIDLNTLGLDEFEPVLSASEKDSLTAFESNVFHHLEILQTLGDEKPSALMIPRDSLFWYFVLLQAIAINFDDRESIYQLLNEALISQYDR